MKISTFNIQNDYKNYSNNKSITICNYIKENKIDIIGLQELPSIYYKELKLLLNDYNITGKYRNRIKFLFPKSNEKNPIITKYPVIKSKTYHLPSFPSIFKRILTWTLIKDKEEISIYNTHLEVKNNKIKEKQLNKIYNILIKDKKKKILMGDFNMTPNDKIMLSFINKLKDIELIKIEEQTLKKYQKTIDYIFISKNLKHKNDRVVKELNISDHYPIITEIY